MNLENPKARAYLLWGIRELSVLDRYEGRAKIVAYDDATVPLDPVLDENDASILIGSVLYDAQEARAVNGVRAALLGLYALHGGQAADEQIANHPYILSVVCAAAYPVEILERNDARPPSRQIEA